MIISNSRSFLYQFVFDAQEKDNYGVYKLIRTYKMILWASVIYLLKIEAIIRVETKVGDNYLYD